MVVGENIKWVIIEVGEADDVQTAFVAPLTLKLEPGWVGTIVWFVFTPGWALDSTDGIQFPAGSGFDGQPQPDPARANCWSTAAANITPGIAHYTINVRHDVKGPASTGDPVVENEAPPELGAAAGTTRILNLAARA
ncbi:MAG TPA: hypothetical protein VF911_10640 [Thermoanaerobaculia bacterium]|jgi:hypothetical protein